VKSAGSLCLVESTTAQSLVTKAYVALAKSGYLLAVIVVKCRRTCCAATAATKSRVASLILLQMAPLLSSIGLAYSSVRTPVADYTTAGSIVARNPATDRIVRPLTARGPRTLFLAVRAVKRASVKFPTRSVKPATTLYRTAPNPAESSSTVGMSVKRLATKESVLHVCKPYPLFAGVGGRRARAFATKGRTSLPSVCVFAE
jgi:hypothetical protein